MVKTSTTFNETYWVVTPSPLLFPFVISTSPVFIFSHYSSSLCRCRRCGGGSVTSCHGPHRSPPIVFCETLLSGVGRRPDGVSCRPVFSESLVLVVVRTLHDDSASPRVESIGNFPILERVGSPGGVPSHPWTRDVVHFMYFTTSSFPPSKMPLVEPLHPSVRVGVGSLHTVSSH